MAASSQPAPTLYTPELIETRPLLMGAAYAIDRVGTIDVDDAIHIPLHEGYRDGSDYRFSVLISDATLLALHPTVVDSVLQRCASEYHGKCNVQPMIPIDMASQISLGARVEVGVPALSADFLVSPEAITLKGLRNVRAKVDVISHEDFEKRLCWNDKKANVIKRIGNLLGRHLRTSDETTDSVVKPLVSKYMIATNYMLAQFAFGQKIELIYRYQDGFTEDGCQPTDRALYGFGNTFREHRKMKKVNGYAGFTSPLRRADHWYNLLAISGMTSDLSIDATALAARMNFIEELRREELRAFKNARRAYSDEQSAYANGERAA